MVARVTQRLAHAAIVEFLWFLILRAQHSARAEQSTETYIYANSTRF